MAGDAKKLQPIIIKRVKKGGHAVHGGAWKIAYADFVTAMMAFFLLMWLLGSTTEGDKKGIADYFGTPLKLALLNGGSGSGDSSHVVKGGGEDLTRSTGQVKRGDMEAVKSTINVHQLKAEQMRAEISRLEDTQRKLEKAIAANPKIAGLSSQILLEMTRDGLRIQIVDAEGRPMFTSGSAQVQPAMREVLRELGKVLGEVPNRLTLEGHTDALPFGNGEQRGYSNWELSADRANASRRELVGGGLPEDQVLRVQGLAASNPFDRRDPAAPANRRISIVVMTREAEEALFRTTPALTDEELGAGVPGPAAAPPTELPRPSSPATVHR
ncbi:MAG: motility protein MotB [Leptothrix sp. (in: Bacteria)]|nr:motility protein MotB [Leptothrix sp. (in: b-proteobacteria)]